MVTVTVVGIFALLMLAWFEWEQHQQRRAKKHAH